MDFVPSVEISGSSSAAETRSRRKRHNISPAAHKEAKRLKTVLEFGRSSHSPRISVPLDRLQQPITPNDLTELLHYAALGKPGGIKQPSWCRLHHQKRVTAVNVVMVEGLTQSHFYKHYLTLRHLRTNYTTRVTFTPSSTNLASEIFTSEVPESDNPALYQGHNGCSKVHKALMIHPVITKFGTQRRGLTAYVLTQEEMIKRQYPVKGMPGFEDFVCTDSVDCVTDSSPLYGLDCEMCLTQKGHELTRVSLVDSDGKCLLDDLVKPPNPILDYLTMYTHTNTHTLVSCQLTTDHCVNMFSSGRFSGVTAELLRPVTTTLRDVQVKLRTLLPRDAVLVGHSLSNDLKALKLIHQHVIDTSLLYRREFGQRFKLKVLAETVLGRKIQTEEGKGHDPTEDAVAALELAQYFIKRGPRQVVELHLEELWGYTIVEEPAIKPSQRFADILQTLGQSVAFLGKRSDVALDLSNQQWYSSDKEMLSSFRRRTKYPFLSVLHFSSLSDRLKRRYLHDEHQYQSMCANLRDMCVVFAGPLPADFSEREVKRLFCCCGPIGNIKMLNTNLRVHAEVEFDLLEGAVLALTHFNGLHVQGQSIKVQRPVYESMLDLDLTLDALKGDRLNTSHLYAVKSKPSMAQSMHISARVNGHTSDGECSGVTSFKKRKVNGQWSQSNLSEEAVRETFCHFGSVERVVLSAKPGKRARHALIKFQSSEGKHAAISSSCDLWKENYLVCSSLTPPHLPSWVAMTTPITTADSDGKERTHMQTSSQDRELDVMMGKLDRRLQKLFTSLPEGTLSVVVLLGNTSAQGHLPGLCLMEVKQ